MDRWMLRALKRAATMAIAVVIAIAAGSAHDGAQAGATMTSSSGEPEPYETALSATAAVGVEEGTDKRREGSAGTGEAQGPNVEKNSVRFTVRASQAATYQTSEELTGRSLREALDDVAQRSGDIGAAQQTHVRAQRLDTFVTWPGTGTNGMYAIDEDGTVIDAAAGVRLSTPERWRRELSVARQRLRARHYGALLPWSEARAAVPRMATFDVVDVDTGLTFRAQRRAGSAHADVQPLTKSDSETMKRIYDGAWSWDRHAVLLRLDGKLYAASMNGMPHGGDGIPGNGFNGHFCIHFLGSKTHGKANVDLAHQAMIHKAGGRLFAFLSGLSAYEAADLFLAAYNQQDRQLLTALAADGSVEALIPATFHEQRVKLLRRSDPLPEAAGEQPFATDVPNVAWSMAVTVYADGSSKGRRSTLTFDLVRSPGEGWQIRSVSL